MISSSGFLLNYIEQKDERGGDRYVENLYF
jgi:hypothetical protein